MIGKKIFIGLEAEGPPTIRKRKTLYVANKAPYKRRLIKKALSFFKDISAIYFGAGDNPGLDVIDSEIITRQEIPDSIEILTEIRSPIKPTLFKRPYKRII